MIFAISMDYTVFLLSSAKEHWDRSHDPHEAAIGGLAHSGRVIFAAAAVMVAVFFTFALSGPLPPKEMGVILGVAVLLDAMLVRLVLIPTLLRVFGRHAWALPGWLRETPARRSLRTLLMVELWQTEWCPASRRVRQRLTELGIDYIARQVPVERENRLLLRERTGSDTIPVLVTIESEVIVGEDAITAYLDTRVPASPEARARSPEGGEGPPPLPAGGMRMLGTSYTLSALTSQSFDATVERVRDELKSEGFGVLSEIDVQATLHEKLGVDEEPYLILGACNPPLAHQALSAEPDLGTLLPCNVVIYQRKGQTHISAIDAEQMLTITGNDNLTEIASQVRAKLAAVVERAGNPA